CPGVVTLQRFRAAADPIDRLPLRYSVRVRNPANPAGGGCTGNCPALGISAGPGRFAPRDEDRTPQPDQNGIWEGKETALCLGADSRLYRPGGTAGGLYPGN